MMHNSAEAETESFDFDELVDRTRIDSLKWNGLEDELPMWVADMDFKVAPAIIEALHARVDNGTFGYTVVPDRYRACVANWWRRRHGLEVDPGNVLFSTGVIPALTAAIASLTSVGEFALVTAPVYNNFYDAIHNAGRRVMESPLIYDGKTYRFDFDDLDRRLADPCVTLLVLCNPHNPGGMVWTRDDLAQVGELCSKHRVTVISDEIHCDIMHPGVRHVPFAAASELCRSISVTLSSASKAFNVAGLQSAYAFADDPLIRNRVAHGFAKNAVADPNDFAIVSTIAAYDQSEAWLDAVCAYIQQSKDYARAAINDAVCEVHVLDADCSYLPWIDCSALLARRPGTTSADFADFLQRETGLRLSPGTIYGAGGEHFVRMNLGTQRSRVEDGVARFIEGCRRW